MRFFFVYKALAHPESDGYLNPLSLEERLLHVREAQRSFKGVSMPWLCDNMSNELKKTLGGLNNPEFLFDPEGKIVSLRDWSSPKDLRADLVRLVGTVSTPTRVEDLNLEFEKSPPVAPRGVVPRIKVPAALKPVQVTPKDSGESPYYAKLRAEGDDELLKTGEGTLYLGLHLDRLYNVHWNNLVAPIEYELSAAEGTIISPRTGKGPKVEAAADSDPREFLVSVRGGEAANPLRLIVRYYACNDAEGWCKLVTQSYVIHLERDRDAGVVRAREWGAGRRPGGPPNRGPGGPEGGGPQGGFSVERLFRFDKDGDGKVSKEELPEFLRGRILERMDANQDGVIEKKEAERIFGTSAGN